MAVTDTTGFRDPVIDCACVIHGTAYDWTYVERLHNMVRRNITGDVRWHVYTEAEREVPAHMIKHALIDWPKIRGPKRGWWYKMQLFNPYFHTGNIMYFDLDTVIVGNLDWIRNIDPTKFWAIRDFRYLQRRRSTTFNSSMMWFNVERHSYVWQEFDRHNVDEVTRRYPGDQDFITANVRVEHQRLFPEHLFQSYRWQALDGGFDFRSRKFHKPRSGVTISPDASVLVFHGSPKPHEVADPVIQNLWQ
jgi:hypothetical protein